MIKLSEINLVSYHEKLRMPFSNGITKYTLIFKFSNGTDARVNFNPHNSHLNVITLLLDLISSILTNGKR